MDGRLGFSKGIEVFRLPCAGSSAGVGRGGVRGSHKAAQVVRKELLPLQRLNIGGIEIKMSIYVEMQKKKDEL